MKMVDQAQKVIDVLVAEGKEPPFWATRQKQLAKEMLAANATGGDYRYKLNELLVLQEEYREQIDKDTSFILEP
ncbi:hypothetical protein ACSX1C_00265 [Pseudomonas sp. MBLB4123]|uniref:hypothetical protein n=1 Tax=Pseudomonas sp. MBLB4123 TaxID=3451557 RepID=UPI003F753493